MPSLVHRLTVIAVYVALLMATAWLLEQMARWQFTAYLRDQAAHALVLAARADTPYRWDYHPDNIIAGRVFGDASFDFTDDCLLVDSLGQPFEIGLRLQRPMALRDFPRLRLYAFPNTPAQVQLVVREQLDGSEWSTPPFALAGISTATEIELDKIDWHSPVTARAPLPAVAATLRLRFTLPRASVLQFNGAVLNRSLGTRKLDLAQPSVLVDLGRPTAAPGLPVYRLPFRPDVQEVDLATIENYSINPQLPLILLPQRGRVEQQIALRNTVFAAAPSAVLIPEDALQASFTQARNEAAAPPVTASPRLRWMWVAAYAMILGYFRWRPPHAPRLRAFAEIVLTLACPLWLIVGDRFEGNPDLMQKLLIGLSLAYAISLSVPKTWRWNGSTCAWLLAGAVVVFAALLGFVAHRPDAPLRAIGAGHIARYLAWAVLQQYLICAVCTERWRIVTGNTAIAIYLGALGFALMHTPNAALMLATLFGGLCWCSLYLRERALLPLAVSHAASALLLLALVPTDILASAEVSARFFF